MLLYNLDKEPWESSESSFVSLNLLLPLGGNVMSSDLIRVSCSLSGDAHVQPGGNNYTKPCLLSLLILPAVNLSAVAWNKAAGSVPALGSAL